MIENTVASVVYTADGAQTQWTIPFTYGHVEDVKLFVKIGTADIAPVASNLFSIDTELNTITYPLSGDPLTANDKVIVMRVTSQTQEESSSMLSFKSEDIERMADKLTMEVQELQEQLSRCIAFNPVDAAEGELDAQQYINDLTELKDTATTQATIATTKAGEAATSATASEASKVKSQKWAEGTDQEVSALGGTHSSKGWAAISQEAAESPAVQTVAENIEDINTVAGISMDVSTVSSIHSKVSTVADDITNIDAVVDNKTNIDTVANNITSVNNVAAIKNDVTTVASNNTNVTTVATNISDVNDVADDIDKVTSVANNLTAINAVKNNLTEINAVNDNKTNINAVAGNATNINTVAADKTNIDAVASNATNINTVATNISDVNDVADDIAKVAAVADDLTAINAVNSNKTNIDTVATNISDVTSVAASIADVAAVADDLTNIDNVADDLTNIDTVAASLPDIQDKQNKVLTNSVILGGETQTTVEGALEAISEDWVKPSDWVDIESGAVENSITLLVAHSAPTESGGVYTVATYPQFHILAQVSTAANTYDVFVDGVKVATTASGTKTVIDWGTLYGAGTVSTIYTTTTPESLVYHIVRVSPTTATDTLTQFQNNVDSSNTNQGILWAHYQLSNPIAISMAFGGGSRPRNTILQAVTAKNDTLIYTVSSTNFRSGFYSTFAYCSSLVKVPVLQAESQTYASGTYISFRRVPAKRIIIKNNSGLENFGALNHSKIRELIAENGLSFESTLSAETSMVDINNLKKLPAISSNMGENILISRADSLQDTVIDDSTNTNRKVFRFFGTAEYPNNGLKGLTVSSSAPFNGAGPQINVSYTGLNRSALIRLFNSMPYNVGYEVVGSPTITDGVVSGFSPTSNVTTTSSIGNTEDDLEIVIAVNNATVDAGISTVIGGPLAFGVSFNYGQKITAYVRNIYDNWIWNGAIGTSRFANNTNYLFKFLQQKVNGSFNISILSSADNGNTWTTEVTTTSTYPVRTSSALVFGGTANSSLTTQYQRGSIDLNNTYIKVNGVPWFTGKAAMTKTCSIVGCTGTADLTADDKAIATGKGWELTVE